MKRRMFVGVMVGGVAALLMGASCRAQETKTEEGWRELFNGKDLTGWKAKKEAKDGGPTVEEGAIAIKDHSGDIWTVDEFGDFSFDFEFKLAKGANSGVIIRTAKPPDWFSGIEIQLIDSFGKEKLGKHDIGAIYDCVAPTKNTIKAPDEWNRMVITARGNKIQVALNGEEILSADMDQWTEAGKNPDGTPNKFKTAYKDMPKRGAILLQGHGSTLWFRNIKIKELK